MNKSPIEWCDYTWNPIRPEVNGKRRGWFCTKIATGCANCYAERMNRRCSPAGDGIGNGLTFTAANEARVRFVLDEAELHKAITFRAKPKPGRVFTGPARVFVADMTDLFHPLIPFDLIDSVWAAMALRPDVTFMVLTKRADRMREYLDDKTDNRAHAIEEQMRRLSKGAADGYIESLAVSNVQLGVSVSSQADADRLIPTLLQCPAAVRFVSYEPALGPVDFTQWTCARLVRGIAKVDPLARVIIDGVIAGGESGPKARPAHPDWFRSVRDQCAAAGVPFFFKQWGEWAPHPVHRAFSATHFVCEAGHYDRLNDDRIAKHRDGDECVAATIGTCRVGRQAAGRHLDGRTHDELPEVKHGQG